jgi:hypothetical protein
VKDNVNLSLVNRNFNKEMGKKGKRERKKTRVKFKLI